MLNRRRELTLPRRTAAPTPRMFNIPVYVAAGRVSWSPVGRGGRWQ